MTPTWVAVLLLVQAAGGKLGSDTSLVVRRYSNRVSPLAAEAFTWPGAYISLGLGVDNGR